MPMMAITPLFMGCRRRRLQLRHANTSWCRRITIRCWYWSFIFKPAAEYRHHYRHGPKTATATLPTTALLPRRHWYAERAKRCMPPFTLARERAAAAAAVEAPPLTLLFTITPAAAAAADTLLAFIIYYYFTPPGELFRNPAAFIMSGCCHAKARRQRHFQTEALISRQHFHAADAAFAAAGIFTPLRRRRQAFFSCRHAAAASELPAAELPHNYHHFPIHSSYKCQLLLFIME